MAAIDMKSTDYYQSGRQKATAAAGREVTNARVCCRYCHKETNVGNLGRHVATCYLNPAVLRECEVCGKPVKNYKDTVTCSRSCSNRLFSPRRNVNCATSYTAICFRNHEKRCAICGEEGVVAVHHYDENRDNNDPFNLVPMCPTHHGYMHSGLKKVLAEHVDSYRAWWAAEKIRLEALAAADAIQYHGRVRLTRSTVPKGWLSPFVTMVPRPALLKNGQRDRNRTCEPPAPKAGALR